MVFELVGDLDQSKKWLAKHPDLLLVDQESPSIAISGLGVIFRDTVYASPPRVLEAKTRREEDGFSYELAIGDDRFPMSSDATPLAQRLKSWFQYYFVSFQPQLAEVHLWEAPGKPRPLYYEQPVSCPRCRRQVLVRTGEIGVLLAGPRG